MECNLRLLLSAVLGLGTLAGCQNWSAVSSGFPMQNPSRVPPPGTGTYPTSPGYYNNSNSTLPTTQANGASAATNTSLSGPPVVRANWQADPAPSPNGANNVSVASFNRSPASASQAPIINPSTDAQFTGTIAADNPPATPATASLSDSNSSQLNWQVPR